MDIDFDNDDGLEPNDLKRPVLIWDGDCGFCRRSVAFLAEKVGVRVRYVTYQTVGDRFEGLGEEDFKRSVYLIETDGSAYHGADAVFRALDKQPGGSALRKLYDNLPGFAPLSEWGYRRVSNNRKIASKLWPK